MKKLLLCAAFAAFSLPVAAHADIDTLTFTPSDNSVGFSFNFDTTASAANSNEFAYYESVPFTFTDGRSGLVTILGFFNTSVLSGADFGYIPSNSGVEVDYAGSQLYTGPESDPVFQLGTVEVTSWNNEPHVGGTITISDNSAVSATPEPSSFVLLGTGILGLVGAARRRFRNA